MAVSSKATTALVGGPNDNAYAGAAWVFTPCMALHLETLSLPNATRGTPYTYKLAACGGASPYKWKAHGLPKGLRLTRTGEIVGTPSKRVAPSYQLSVRITDSGRPKESVKATLRLRVD